MINTDITFLGEISEKEFGYPDSSTKLENYTIVKAVRLVLFNKHSKIAMLHVQAKGYHDLPGGKVDANENNEDALRREINEELGFELEDIELHGIVLELRHTWNTLRIEYVYTTHTNEVSFIPQLTNKEMQVGTTPLWLGINEAIYIFDAEKKLEDIAYKFRAYRNSLILYSIVENLG